MILVGPCFLVVVDTDVRADYLAVVSHTWAYWPNRP